jgi:hypothetical protein
VTAGRKAVSTRESLRLAPGPVDRPLGCNHASHRDRAKSAPPQLPILPARLCQPVTQSKGMSPPMNPSETELVLFIHTPAIVPTPVDGVVAAIGPYLGTFGERSTLVVSERLEMLRGDGSDMVTTVVRITLYGEAHRDLLTLVAKLRKFLKQAAKNANAVMGFEMHRPLPNHADEAGVRGTMELGSA